MNSLKSRLFLILVAATSLIWLTATCWIYVGATREIESVLDSRLQEAARMVLSLASGNDAAAALKDDDSASVPEIMSYERQLSCQIWSLDGRLVARSSGAPDESLSDKRAGFSQRLIKGETWRVYTAEDPAKGVRVSVGDRLGLRSHLVGEIIKGLLAPLLLAIPLLGLLIYASLGRGLLPLQALARELGHRNADDMSPVATGTIPAEIQPVVASLNHLFRKVREAMQHERELTAFAAHELRTPLAGLRTQAQIAMVTGDGNVRKAALRQIMVEGEQAPNPSSRIRLSEATDALGMRRVVADWRLTDLDRHSTQQLVLTIATEMARLYKARMSVPFWLTDSQTDWSRHLRDVAHHMGTTRMADSENRGVVDADCRVFGVPNLFIAGSSVFPTGGQANPTLTIVALALRLADHLKSKLA